MSTITTVNPATGENIESFEMISAKDAAAKLEACHKAFSEWKLKSLEDRAARSEGHTAELQSRPNLVCRLPPAKTN